MGFARKTLVQGSMWFGKRKDARVREETPLIPGDHMIICGVEQQAVLQSGAKDGYNSQREGSLDA